MTTFSIKQQTEVDESYQGFILTEFSFVANEKVTDEAIIDAFIHSEYFTLESLRNTVKRYSHNGFYLRRAFDMALIKIDDFQKSDKTATTKFLIDFLNKPDWGEDRGEFAKLLDRYIDTQTQPLATDYFLLSKDWFEKGDKRILDPEEWIYAYYFLIICIDRQANTLILCEWLYD